MPREHYDQLDAEAVNWSKLKIMRECPAKYKHALGVKQEDTDALRLGRATHWATLEPEQFDANVIKWEGGARRGKDWNVFKAEHKGQEILNENEHAMCLSIANAVRTHPEARRYVTGGEAEKTLRWKYTREQLGEIPGFQMDLKCRVDYITKDAVIDLKTTADASIQKFGRQAFDLGYHGQAAFYSDGYEAVSGERKPFVIVAVEKEAPFVVQCYPVDEEPMALGQDLYRSLLDMLHHCRQTDNWPGYAQGPVGLQLPHWAWPFDEDDAEGMGITFGGSNGA